MSKKKAFISISTDLHYFLSKNNRKEIIEHEFWGEPTIKDVVESYGIPHVEIDLILLNENSIDFDYNIKDGEHFKIYSVITSNKFNEYKKLSPENPTEPKFILDVHLGKLCKYLRLLGFDTLYKNDFEDPEIIRIALEENRIILTRDLGILKHTRVKYGYFLRSQNSEEQLDEVIKRYSLLDKTQIFKRCTICNGLVKKVDKSEVKDEVPDKVINLYNDFFQCISCKHFYWEGSHFDNLTKFINNLSNY